MLVEQLIRQLERYPRDEEIYVEYWDKETAEANAEVTLTDEEWEDVVYTMEDWEPYYSTSYYVSEKVLETVEKRKEK